MVGGGVGGWGGYVIVVGEIWVGGDIEGMC